ncbi:hypothetical protein DPX16_22881 [Anabarilius grahami]|uniref:Uncharacterized protein n=1 Tax=Anabarilius grahami TaxID=495550 RepID=A0A3N0YGZ2_ANAGA|nr:hypothetical protein DPX16_22881 [Anabarilius grahami]
MPDTLQPSLPRDPGRKKWEETLCYDTQEADTDVHRYGSLQVRWSWRSLETGRALTHRRQETQREGDTLDPVVVPSADGEVLPRRV